MSYLQYASFAKHKNIGLVDQVWLTMKLRFEERGLYHIQKRINYSDRVLVNTAGNMGLAASLVDITQKVY